MAAEAVILEWTKMACSRKHCFRPSWRSTVHNQSPQMGTAVQRMAAELHSWMCACIVPAAILMDEEAIQACTHRKVTPWRTHFLGPRPLARCAHLDEYTASKLGPSMDWAKWPLCHKHFVYEHFLKNKKKNVLKTSFKNYKHILKTSFRICMATTIW